MFLSTASSQSCPRSRRLGQATAALVTALALVLGTTTVGADAKPALKAAVAASTPAYAHSRTEAFSTTGWWKTWGLTTLPWHTAVVTEGTSQFLRVNFPAGSHNGTSFDLLTGTSDSAHLQYKIRLSSNWQSNGGKLPGFGMPTYNADNSCSGGCGLAPADGITSWSARGHINGNNVPGSYLYTADKTEWAFQWNTAALVPGRWYTIDYWVTMNTPGQNDGILRAAVDGVTVLNWTTMNFRKVSSLHVGKAWFDFYYGGSSVPSQNMWIDIDDVAVDY